MLSFFTVAKESEVHYHSGITMAGGTGSSDPLSRVSTLAALRRGRRFRRPTAQELGALTGRHRSQPETPAGPLDRSVDLGLERPDFGEAAARRSVKCGEVTPTDRSPDQCRVSPPRPRRRSLSAPCCGRVVRGSHGLAFPCPPAIVRPKVFKLIDGQPRKTGWRACFGPGRATDWRQLADDSTY